MRRSATAPVLVGLALFLGGCAGPSARTSAGGNEATPCERVVPECHAKRLPDVTLSGDATDGALGPVTEPLEGTISFDQALAAAWREDGQGGAKTVQVVLGSADAQTLHWDSKGDLFYAVKWSGVCIMPMGRPQPSPIPPPSCVPSVWGTVIDAHTGAFIVGGN